MKFQNQKKKTKQKMTKIQYKLLKINTQIFFFFFFLDFPYTGQKTEQRQSPGG